MSTRQRPAPSSYRKHRQRAAVRRRRIVLLMVLGLALCIVGGAMAWPRQDTAAPAASAAKAKKKGKANTAKAQADGGAAAAASAGVAGGDAPAEPTPPTDVGTIVPDDQPSAQAQKAIDTALANGRPPQFVVVSFDGAADYRMYDRWLKVGDETGARFTFFVSGIYMMLPDKAVENYQPPNEPAGFSNLGGYAELAGPKSAEENLRDNINDFNEARAQGHEIGSHYVSHICEPSDAWTVDDWISEETQFERLMTQPSTVNGMDLPTPIYTVDDFHGGRTPCLSGNKENLYAAMAQMGFAYDASQSGVLGEWPRKQQGLWNFPLPTIERVGSEYPTLAMDYNFYVNHGEATSQAQADEFSELTYQSYIGAIDGLQKGTRAPFITGSHFANWNMGAYMNALERTVREVCARPEVACVNMVTLAHWLDRQDPAQLEQWRSGQWGTKAATGAATASAAS